MSGSLNNDPDSTFRGSGKRNPFHDYRTLLLDSDGDRAAFDSLVTSLEEGAKFRRLSLELCHRTGVCAKMDFLVCCLASATCFPLVSNLDKIET